MAVSILYMSKGRIQAKYHRNISWRSLWRSEMWSLCRSERCSLCWTQSCPVWRSETCSLCRATLKITQGRDLEMFAIDTELTEDDLEEDNAIRYGWKEFRIHRYVSGPNPRGKITVKIYVCDNCHYEILKSVSMGI